MVKRDLKPPHLVAKKKNRCSLILTGTCASLEVRSRSLPPPDRVYRCHGTGTSNVERFLYDKLISRTQDGVGVDLVYLAFFSSISTLPGRDYLYVRVPGHNSNNGSLKN